MSKVVIHQGKVKSIYSDEESQKIMQLLGGKATIKRVSHIEAPTIPLEEVEFQIDLTLSKGPILRGFKTYQEAVKKEIDWVNKNILI